MNKVDGAIPNLTNAALVLAAFDIQSEVAGKIVAASVSFTDSGHKFQRHGLTFKRTADNHNIQIFMAVERGETSCDGERYGAPSIRLHSDAVHEADKLIRAVVSLFGGSVRVSSDDADPADHPWDDIACNDQSWTEQIPEGRATQIRLLDEMPVQGLLLLQTFGLVDPEPLLKFRDVLTPRAAL